MMYNNTVKIMEITKSPPNLRWIKLCGLCDEAEHRSTSNSLQNKVIFCKKYKLLVPVTKVCDDHSHRKPTFKERGN